MDDLMHIKLSGLPQVASHLKALPSDVAHANKSGLKSTGWWITRQMRNHIEYGGSNWAPLSPLTKKFKRANGRRKWSRRQSPVSPLFYLGKFCRYNLDEKGEMVQIFMGKTSKGTPGRADKWLQAVAKRTEYGKRIPVTKESRRAVATTRTGRSKKAVRGEAWFAFNKQKKFVEYPKRPISAPVFKKNKTRIPVLFQQKFAASFARQLKKRGLA